MNKIELPCLDCGLCGYKSFEQFDECILTKEEVNGRCIYVKM